MTPDVAHDVLPGGLRVMTARMPQSHGVYCAVWVGAGSLNDAGSEQGSAELLAQVLLGGSERYPGGHALQAAVEAGGGALNAEVDGDATRFDAWCHPDALPEVLTVLGDLLSRPSLLTAPGEEAAQLVERERTRQRINLRARRYIRNDIVNRLFFGDHPVARDGSGALRDLEHLDVAALRARFEQAYVTGNLLVTVAGPIDRDHTLNVVREAFAGVRHGARAPQVPMLLPEATEPRFQLEVSNGNSLYAALVFALPSAPHPDAPALSVMTGLLSQGFTPRIQRAVRGLGLAYAPGTHIDPYRDVALFYLTVNCAPGNVVPALREMLKAIARPMSAEEFAQVRAHEAADDAMHATMPNYVCFEHGCLPEFGPGLTPAQWAGAYAAVTLDDVHRVWRQWLTATQLALVPRCPLPMEKELREVCDDAAKLLTPAPRRWWRR